MERMVFLKSQLRNGFRHLVIRAAPYIAFFLPVPGVYERALPVFRKMAQLENMPWAPADERRLGRALSAFRVYSQFYRVAACAVGFLKGRGGADFDTFDIWQKATREFGEVGQLPKTRITPDSFVKSKRLLFLSGIFPSLRHGGGVRVFDIISELSNSYQVDLFAVFDNSDDKASLELLQKKLRNCEVVASSDFTPARLQEWLKSKGASLHAYQAILLEWHHTHVFLPCLAEVSGRVIFTLIENIHRAHFLRLRQLLAEDRFVEAGRLCLEIGEVLATEERLWKGVDARIAVSDADGLSAQALFGLEFKTVLTGVSDTAILQDLATLNSYPVPQNREDELTAGFVGYFAHPPNLEGMQWYLRKVHPLVKAQVPRYRLRVIGGGDTNSLKSEFGSDPSIEITGFVPNVVAEILKSTICLSPLISGAGLRGKLIQYSICGRASVSTPVGASGLPFVHRESVLIAQSAEDFAESTIALLSQRDLRERIASNAKLKAQENFSWS